MSAAVAALGTRPPGLLSDLLLVRLLPPSKRPPSPGQVRADLDKFFRRPPSTEQWGEVTARLKTEGLLQEKSLRLSDNGQSQALAFLGIKELPPRATWKTIKARYLLRKALDISSTEPGASKRIQRADALAALLLRRRFQLPVAADASLSNVLEALACKELGFPQLSSLADLKAQALSRLLGESQPLKPSDLARQVPRILLGATRGGLDGLRDTVLAGWGDSPDHESVASESPAAEFELETFANTVRAAARDCPTGRVGDNKVFISHVWKRLRDEPGLPRLDLPAFKSKLVEANARRLLTLSRADLVQLMEPGDVAESETPYLNAVFHLILVDGKLS